MSRMKLMRYVVLVMVLTCATVCGDLLADKSSGVSLRFSLRGATDDKPVSVTVSGQITDSDRNKAIPNALVRGHILVWRHQGPELFDKCPYAQVMADANGRYELRFVTPLTISGAMKGKDGICIYASAPGYETRPLYVRPKLTHAKTTYTDVNIALGSGKLLKGRIVDEQNKPIDGALVRVQSGRNGDWGYFGSLGKTYTDKDGNFQIWYSTDRREIIGSNPWLRVSKKGYGLERFWDLLEKESMGTLVLPGGETIVGQVIDREGRPVANCEISVRDMWPNEFDKTTTDNNGRYQLKGIPGRSALSAFYKRKNPGSKLHPSWLSVTVYARVDPQISLRDVPQYKIAAKDGETATGSDLVIGANTSVSGRLLPSKTLPGLKGFMVRLDYEWANMVQADADGRFGFPYVQPGKHRLTAYLPNNLRGDRGIGHVEINVEPGEPLADVRIQLDTLAEVRLQVLDAKGNPLEGVTAGATWTKSGDGLWTEGTRSGRDGWAVLYLHSEQVQYVRAFDQDRALVAEGYHRVKPKAAEVIENLRVIMVPTARIVGSLGVGGGGAESLSGKRILYSLKYADGVERKGRLKIDSSGSFEMNRLTPGVVRLNMATSPIELSAEMTEPMEIKPGENKDIGRVALEKIKFYKVSGKILSSPTFDALEGFKMRLGLAAWEPMVTTDAQGRFVLKKVQAGKHRLTAYLPFNRRTDRGVGHMFVEVKDSGLDNVELQLETLATIHMRIVDEAGKPLEGISAAAWWTKNHHGVFTEGTKSDKQGRATLYLYPQQLQYIGAHDWAGKYRLKSDRQFNLKPGETVQDVTVTMLPANGV